MLWKAVQGDSLILRNSSDEADFRLVCSVIRVRDRTEKMEGLWDSWGGGYGLKRNIINGTMA